MTRKNQLSAKQILNFVNFVQDPQIGARFEDRFAAVMTELNSFLPFHRGLCILLDKRSIEAPTQQGGLRLLFDDDLLKDRRVIHGDYTGTDDYGSYFCQFDPTANVAFGQIGQPVRFTDCDPSIPGGRLFRNDFLKPNGIEHGLGSCFAFGDNELLTVSLLRDDRAADFTETERDLLKLLGPVLARSAGSAIQSELLHQGIIQKRDGSEPGIILASSDGEIEFSDAEAISLIEKIGGGLGASELIRSAAASMDAQNLGALIRKVPVFNLGRTQWLELKFSRIGPSRLALTIRPIANGSHQRFDAAASFAGLTPRETEVARLVVRGLINKEIALELGLSIDTVKEYIAKACRKCAVKGRTALTSFLIG